MRCKVDAGLPTEAVLLAMRDLLYLVQRSLDHPFGCRRQQILRTIAAQETVDGMEPVGHAPAILVLGEGVDDSGQCLDWPEACRAIQAVTGE